MGVRAALVTIAVLGAGCGRLAFDARGGADDDVDIDAGHDAATDAPTQVRPGDDPCLRNIVASDPVVITGKTYRWTSFSGNRQPVADVTVTAMPNFVDDPIAQTRSDAQGDYTLVIPTGGAPTGLVIDYTPDDGAFMETTVTFDYLVESDLTGPYLNYYNLGDGALWQTSAMTSVYSEYGVTYDNGLGTIAISVRDCNNAPVAGATVMTDPPSSIGYQDDDGLAAPAGTTETQPVFGHAIAMRAAPGPTTVSATHPTRMISTEQLVVDAGDNSMVVVLRASDPM